MGSRNASEVVDPDRFTVYIHPKDIIIQVRAQESQLKKLKIFNINGSTLNFAEVIEAKTINSYNCNQCSKSKWSTGGHPFYMDEMGKRIQR